MFDHVALNVRDYRASKAFYEQALAPLGYRLVRDFEDRHVATFGRDRSAFLVNQREPFGTSAHIAFTASDRPSVDAFHAAALAAGGRDNGAPGIREQYDPNYYAAFVYDPDGNNIEAVCRVGPAD